jgi:serine/threonine protein kinase
LELGRKRRDKDAEELRETGEHDPRAQALAWFLVRALHEARDRDAVLVVQRPDGDADRERRTRLVQLAAELAHPALAKIHTSGEAFGLPFQIVEDLREARSLASLIEDKGAAHWLEAVALVKPLAAALERIHAAGLVHAAIALDAIAVDASLSPKLSVDARHLAFPGDPVEPRPWAAPEDATTASARGNLYSLGAVLYALLTGRPPADGPPPPRELVPDVPETLSRLVLDLLARDPERRPANASEVLARLESLA